ncbi:xanthine dehydrogenase family protein molybdopterin-binding subunit [Teichococcus vastitatis]|uniref:xanthine dehydrogenase family protein molybdopterin-binding subunit n=1 Tax=Teichococcus vastitatis TaxID=2307076 RepID=UPI000E76DB28|nr:xanthine dehydrogenase family protein molybdopterin-binding subunit [Pseudoroseomonas vastitatis]
MIGRAVSRVDGPLKVTGGARYAYERQDFGRAAVGFILGASVAKGRIVRLDTAAAERAPGVLHVMTHWNAPAQGPRDGSLPDQFGRPWPVLQGERVSWFGQPVALVVAETFEQARSAAALIDAAYETEAGAFDLASHAHLAYAPRTAAVGLATDSVLGDLDAAMASADVTIDQNYTTPAHFAQPMEPQSCLAHWVGDDLHVRPSAQGVAGARMALARTIRIPRERVHVDTAFVGGGFGSKLRVHEEAVFAALAARVIARAVKVAQTRRQVFTITGRRPETIQRVRLAASRDGRLTGVGHDVNMQGTSREEFVEQTATVLRSLYAAPNRLTRHRVTDLDVGLGEAVRGPGELPGLLAVESAMDELAHELGLDPIELRILNEPERDPERNVPFSERRLVECMREGAARFGWSARAARPGSRREGDELIGIGMAAAIRMHFQGATRAAVHMGRDGRVVVRSDMTDIGTGTYTILAQVAADALGVPLARVTVELARSDLPPSPGSGGSWGASNSSNAVHRACESLKEKVFGSSNASGFGRADLTSVVSRRFPDGVEGEGSIVGMADDPNYRNFSQHTYGASFAEVAVNTVTGEVRLRRMLGVFAAGRIINSKTTRSQLLGGMIWGVSSALHEAAHVDPRYGNVVNGDLAEYVVPVHADIPAALEAVLLDGIDDKANPLGMKGVGELGVCGTGAAVANAVFNATGVRVRDFPITMDKLLAALPPAF